MKTKLAVVIFLVIYLEGSAAIRNGYANELQLAVSSLQNVQRLLEDPALDEREKQKLLLLHRRVKSRLDLLQEQSARTISVIDELKTYDPELFDELNSIVDANGTVTDVYVKAIYHMAINEGLVGTTNLSQSSSDPNVYHSAYGDHTVSVKIDAGPRAIDFLIHELGHVRYQVPNLKTYVQFYRRYYHNSKLEKGHLYHDPSNHAVQRTIQDFRMARRLVLRNRRSKDNTSLLMAQLKALHAPRHLP